MMDKLGNGKMMQIAMKNFGFIVDHENPNYLEPNAVRGVVNQSSPNNLLPTTPHHRHLTQSDF